MTAITRSTVFAKIYQDASGIWSIQNLMSGSGQGGFYSNTGESGIWSYNLRVADTKAYIILTMTANGTADTVQFTFSQGVYTAQSGWKVWN